MILLLLAQILIGLCFSIPLQTDVLNTLVQAESTARLIDPHLVALSTTTAEITRLFRVQEHDKLVSLLQNRENEANTLWLETFYYNAMKYGQHNLVTKELLVKLSAAAIKKGAMLAAIYGQTDSVKTLHGLVGNMTWDSLKARDDILAAVSAIATIIAGQSSGLNNFLVLVAKDGIDLHDLLEYIVIPLCKLLNTVQESSMAQIIARLSDSIPTAQLHDLIDLKTDDNNIVNEEVPMFVREKANVDGVIDLFRAVSLNKHQIIEELFRTRKFESLLVRELLVVAALYGDSMTIDLVLRRVREPDNSRFFEFIASKAFEYDNEAAIEKLKFKIGAASTKKLTYDAYMNRAWHCFKSLIANSYGQKFDIAGDAARTVLIESIEENDLFGLILSLDYFSRDVAMLDEDIRRLTSSAIFRGNYHVVKCLLGKVGYLYSTEYFKSQAKWAVASGSSHLWFLIRLKAKSDSYSIEELQNAVFFERPILVYRIILDPNVARSFTPEEFLTSSQIPKLQTTPSNQQFTCLKALYQWLEQSEIKKTNTAPNMAAMLLKFMEFKAELLILFTASRIRREGTPPGSCLNPEVQKQLITQKFSYATVYYVLKSGFYTCKPRLSAADVIRIVEVYGIDSYTLKLIIKAIFSVPGDIIKVLEIWAYKAVQSNNWQLMDFVVKKALERKVVLSSSVVEYAQLHGQAELANLMRLTAVFKGESRKSLEHKRERQASGDDTDSSRDTTTQESNTISTT
ncbi:hypothetical protein MP638_007094 [Amoeboaphelidium occidentale]|nr:hypothetical protein MP638_007094 [Amoeboaphelidium occidentale]